MTSKLPKSPLDEPSRPAVAAKMRDDTTVPVALYKKIPAIKNREAVEMDEILFIYSRYRPTLKRCRPDRRQVRNSLSYNAD